MIDGPAAFVQLAAWPGPEQLSLPEQLGLPGFVRGEWHDDDPVPLGIEPVEPPDAPAALDCVATVVTDASHRLEVSSPRVRWFRPRPVQEPVRSYSQVLGVVLPWQRAIWLNIGYGSPQSLATTTAHEVVHHWQLLRRGRWLDDLEFDEREAEAQRRAAVLVPKGTYRTPRGRKGDAWFEPARRRYG